MHKHYDICCTDGAYFLSDKQKKDLGISVDIDKVYDAVIKNVHEGEKNSKQQDRSIIQDQYAQLREAVKEGYGKLSFQVEYGGVNFAMSKNLQTNVAVFSAFKKHDMIKELVKDLRNEDGSLKEWADYRSGAKKLAGEYRETFLHTEYDTAVRGSRMATVWENIQKSKRLYPNIKYIRSRSSVKREDHLSLVGTILPIDHPFWNIHFPPNGYGCKCSAQPTDEKPSEEPAHPDVDPAFAFNPGKDGKVFDTKKHPYSQLPQKEYQTALHEARGALYSYEKKDLDTEWSKQIAKEKLKVPVNGVPQPVTFNSNSLHKNMKLDNYFFERLNLLHNIKEVLEESTYLFAEEPKKSKQDSQKKKHIKQFHRLVYGPADKRVNILIQENKNGECVLYELSFQNKKASE